MFDRLLLQRLAVLSQALTERKSINLEVILKHLNMSTNYFPDLNALKELNLCLAEYCEKTKPNVSQVTKGMVYGAYFSGKYYFSLF